MKHRIESVDLTIGDITDVTVEFEIRPDDVTLVSDNDVLEMSVYIGGVCVDGIPLPDDFINECWAKGWEKIVDRLV